MTKFRKLLVMEDAPTDWRQPILPVCGLQHSGYVFEQTRWSAELLIKTADLQKARVYSLPLKHINLGANVIRYCDRAIDLAAECWRVMHCNVEHPIIIGPTGEILDGVHRVIMALLMGRTHIKARRLLDMPEPDGKGEE